MDKQKEKEELSLKLQSLKAQIHGLRGSLGNHSSLPSATDSSLSLASLADSTTENTNKDAPKHKKKDKIIPLLPSGYGEGIPLPRFKQGLRILTIDGGGIRGLVPIEILDSIEQLCSSPLRDSFDLICGTSTGGIISFAMVVAKKNMKECRTLYEQLGPEIFGNPKQVPFPSIHEVLKLEELLKKRENFGDSHLNDFINSCPKVFAVATHLDQGKPAPFLFRNYDIKSIHSGSSEYFTWEAARATSAAPIYFEPYCKGSKVFLDGGLVANNPVMLAISQAKAIWPDSSIDCLVSVGTGKRTSSSYMNTNLVQLTAALKNMEYTKNYTTPLEAIMLTKMCVEISTSSEAAHEGLMTSHALACGNSEDENILYCNLFGRIKYFRLNPPIAGIGLDEVCPIKLKKMVEDTKKYVAVNMDVIKGIASILKAN